MNPKSKAQKELITIRVGTCHTVNSFGSERSISDDQNNIHIYDAKSVSQKILSSLAPLLVLQAKKDEFYFP
ncbi:MAG: hypothetical protein PUP92_30445 [Rhizonema sp. PD38]|nr:hypothetical protein [Rhizonema sp. PD38]